MIEKPEQYYDTRRHQLYYQWRESEHFSHQEPIYDRTREYIESLEAENATLRTQLADATESMGRVEERCAKLRELVRDMYKAFMHGNCYRWCEFKEPCNYISDGRCQWYDRMRELGVVE